MKSESQDFLSVGLYPWRRLKSNEEDKIQNTEAWNTGFQSPRFDALGETLDFVLKTHVNLAYKAT